MNVFSQEGRVCGDGGALARQRRQLVVAASVAMVVRVLVRGRRPLHPGDAGGRRASLLASGDCGPATARVAVEAAAHLCAVAAGAQRAAQQSPEFLAEFL